VVVMVRRFVRVVAGVAALALAGVGVVATAGSAAAYPTVTPGWVAGDTARNGEIFIYDTNGAQITGGSDYNVIGQFFAGQTTAKTTGATLANLNIAFPDATNSVPSTWFSTTLQGSTAFSTAANRPTAVGPVINKNAWPTGSTPIADTLTGGTLSTATNYQNVFELRMANSGPGGVNGAGKYWAADIEFNPAAVGGATFDGLAPQEWRVLQATPPLATTTSITSVTPASQTVALGATSGSVTAVAAVSPATAAGTVQFKVDGVNSGSPVTVASGSATATLTGLAGSATPGTGHVVTAAFTAAAPATYYVGNANSASTNTAVNATVITPAGHDTSTNLSLSTANVVYGVDTLTATAAVTDINASPVTPVTGSVQFKVDGNNVGSAVALAAGSASLVIPTGSLTASATPGPAHSVTAVFTDGSSFNTSTSASSSFNLIICYLGCGGEIHDFRTSIAAGTLIISTPYYLCSTLSQSNPTPAVTGTCVDNPLVLPAMTLNSAATEYSTSAAFTGISVADTRPGNLAYTLSAISTNLTKVGVASPTANETINAQNVGLNVSSLTSTNSTPNTFLGAQAPGTATTGQNFTGFNNAAAAHVAAGAAGSAGLGGANPHTVLHANSGLGTTVTAGTLSITAPSNTLDGTYAGTVTFSIIGS
jgi:hypothetical protein